MIKGFEIENNPDYILLGLNIMNYEADDNSEGCLVTIGLLIVNLNFYL